MGPEHLFDNVVCASDGTPAGAEAARQADLLTPPGPTLHLVTVVSQAELGGGYGSSILVVRDDSEP
jgi:hypothetical protein